MKKGIFPKLVIFQLFKKKFGNKYDDDATLEENELS